MVTFFRDWKSLSYNYDSLPQSIQSTPAPSWGLDNEDAKNTARLHLWRFHCSLNRSPCKAVSIPTCRSPDEIVRRPCCGKVVLEIMCLCSVHENPRKISKRHFMRVVLLETPRPLTHFSFHQVWCLYLLVDTPHCTYMYNTEIRVTLFIREDTPFALYKL